MIRLSIVLCLSLFLSTWGSTALLATPGSLSEQSVATPETLPFRTEEPLTTVTYQPLDELFPNPERGFYHHTERDSADLSSLDVAELQQLRTNENITLILRLFVLRSFVDSNLPRPYLDRIAADFAAIREAGLKVIVRFAYTVEMPETEMPPWGDADVERILGHLEQLEPILRENSDVIAVVQAGFIGIWGEWYYTDYFVEDPARPEIISNFYYAQRREVLFALLNALPTDRMVQVRTPLQKQRIFSLDAGAIGAWPPARALDRQPVFLPVILSGANNQVPPRTPYDGTEITRTGHHNDCFLASDTDFGTYVNIKQEKGHLAEETKYLPMGGETCNVNPPRSECSTALEELERFHWSYLNMDYHPDVLESWSSGDCMDTVKRRLGYRFTLLEGTYPAQIRAGDELSLEIRLRNDGWAAPYNPRPVELLLRHTESGEIYPFELSADPRFWLADGDGIHSLDESVLMPSDLPAGDYELLLNLPDPKPQLEQEPAYSIRLANEDVWEASTGYNNLLHTITVHE